MGLSNLQAARAEDIRAAVAASEGAARTSIEKALEAGRLLVEAKADCKHGEWLPFLERAGVAERQAQRLMKLARSDLEPDTVSDLGGIKAALLFLQKTEKMVKLRDDMELRPLWKMAFEYTLKAREADLPPAVVIEELTAILSEGGTGELKRDQGRFETLLSLFDDVTELLRPEGKSDTVSDLKPAA